MTHADYIAICIELVSAVVALLVFAVMVKR